MIILLLSCLYKKYKIEDDNYLPYYEDIKTSSNTDLLSKLTIPRCLLKKCYNDINKDNCPVCLHTYLGTSSPVLVLLCGHSFHINCILTSSCCYICKADTNNKEITPVR